MSPVNHAGSAGTRFRAQLWLRCIVAMALFLAGAAVGASVSGIVIHSRLDTYRRSAPIFASDISTRLRIRLGLSDVQTNQVRGILEARHARMMQLRKQNEQAIHREFDSLKNEVGALLSKRQAVQWTLIADSVRRTYLPARSGAP